MQTVPLRYEPIAPFEFVHCRIDGSLVPAFKLTPLTLTEPTPY